MMELNNVTSLRECNWNKSFKGKGITKQILMEEIFQVEDLWIRLTCKWFVWGTRPVGMSRVRQREKIGRTSETPARPGGSLWTWFLLWVNGEPEEGVVVGVQDMTLLFVFLLHVMKWLERAESNNDASANWIQTKGKDQVLFFDKF